MTGLSSAPSFRKALRLAWLSFAALAFMLGVSAAAEETEAGDHASGLLLISIDTLRPDHLGAYGYDRPTSPQIDRFARDAVRFDTVIASAPSTLPSHASIFTSLPVSRHGAFLSLQAPLADGHVTLAELLREAGYETAAFHGGAQMAERFGLGQGFSTYEEVDGPFVETLERARAWLTEHGEERFFLFLHTYAVHHPYTPAEATIELFDEGYDGPLPDHVSVELLKRINRGQLETSKEDRAHIERAYDAEIREMDRDLGRFFDWLKAHGLYERALVVLTSDHGEEFGEHGWVGWHAHTLYDEVLRVPLLIKLPLSAHGGSTVDAMARGVDLAPTVLDLLGLPAADSFEGVSLSPRIRGEGGSVPAAVSERDHQPVTTAVRTERWKLIEGKLFDLAADPSETTPRPDALHRDVRTRLGEEMSRVSRARAQDESGPTTLDPKTEAQLRALGYLD